MSHTEISVLAKVFVCLFNLASWGIVITCRHAVFTIYVTLSRHNSSKYDCSVSVSDCNVEIGAMYILNILHILERRPDKDPIFD